MTRPLQADPSPGWSAARPDLLDTLGEVAAIMHRRGQRGRVYVVGGATMMLIHSADRATQDIDADIEEGYFAVTGAACIVAQRRGWPRKPTT